MAEFSAITIGENTYDIKDATARTGLAGKQNTLTAGTGINIVGDVISATGGGGASEADDVSYDNTSSGLTATNVQDAIDEVNDKKVNKSGDTMSGDLTIVSKGTAETVGASTLILGNNIPRYTDENSLGRIDIYGYEQYRTRLYAASLTADRNIELPDKSGTIALTTDLQASSGTITKLQYATALYNTKVYKLGNLVFISCGWAGSANNSQGLATVPSGFRPSSVTEGSGMIITPFGIVGGVYIITPAGVIEQGTTTGSATGGTFTFIFTV